MKYAVSRKGNVKVMLNPPHLFLPWPACRIVGDDKTGGKQYSSRQLEIS